MKNFFIALQFLTSLPVKIKSDIDQRAFGKSLLYFPIIGALIGLLLSAVVFLFNFLPNLVIGAFVLTVSAVITGGIHLDGFADTCDGLYGARSKEKILDIMRDSRIGVIGVVGIVCLLILKFTLIISIPQDILWKSLIMMAAFARWSQVLACLVSGYVREEGKAKYFVEYAGKKEFLAASVFVMALSFLLMESRGLVTSVLSLLPVFLFINYAKTRIGGMTGDTIGATSELAEVSVLFFTLMYG